MAETGQGGHVALLSVGHLVGVTKDTQPSGQPVLQILGGASAPVFGEATRALDARLRPLEDSVSRGDGRGQRAGSEREAESPRARPPDVHHGADISL